MATTSNGFEIEHPIPTVTAPEMQQRLGSEFGIDGTNPTERLVQLKELSVEGVALMIEDINRLVQGSNGSLMNHDRAMKIGDNVTIKPEDRYNVFNNLIGSIRDCPENINPERVGDVLALGTVLLHPFQDGNGRTARVIGSLFRDSYDNPEEYVSDFSVLAEPRDIARSRGGFQINGYVPRFPEGFDQSDPTQVSEYLDSLLHTEMEDTYTSPYGQAPLYSGSN